MAPFYLPLKVKYTMSFENIDNELMPDKIELKSTVKQHFTNREIGNEIFNVTISSKGISKIESGNLILKQIED